MVVPTLMTEATKEVLALILAEHGLISNLTLGEKGINEYQVLPDIIEAGIGLSYKECYIGGNILVDETIQVDIFV